TRQRQKRPPSQTPWCSDEKISGHNRRHRPAGADHCSVKIGMTIWRKDLQALQQQSESHDGPAHCERPRPSNAEGQRESEIANEVVDVPTESRAWYPLRGA